MAENDADTAEYEVEGIGTVMLNEADAKEYGDRAKKLSATKQSPDPTTAQRAAEQTPEAKAATVPANKATAAASNKA